MQSTLVSVNAVAGGKGGGNPKTTLYVGGLEENVNEAILHSAFIPFGDIKDVNIPLDHATGRFASALVSSQHWTQCSHSDLVQVNIEGLALLSMRHEMMQRTPLTTCTTLSCSAECSEQTMHSP